MKWSWRKREKRTPSWSNGGGGGGQFFLVCAFVRKARTDGKSKSGRREGRGRGPVRPAEAGTQKRQVQYYNPHLPPSAAACFARLVWCAGEGRSPLHDGGVGGGGRVEPRQEEAKWTSPPSQLGAYVRTLHRYSSPPSRVTSLCDATSWRNSCGLLREEE